MDTPQIWSHESHNVVAKCLIYDCAGTILEMPTSHMSNHGLGGTTTSLPTGKSQRPHMLAEMTLPSSQLIPHSSDLTQETPVCTSQSLSLSSPSHTSSNIQFTTCRRLRQPLPDPTSSRCITNTQSPCKSSQASPTRNFWIWSARNWSCSLRTPS